MTRDKAAERVDPTGDLSCQDRLRCPPPFNKAHSAIYALMAYQHLTLRKEGGLMGLTAEQIAERQREAAEKAEAKVDEGAQLQGGDQADTKDETE